MAIAGVDEYNLVRSHCSGDREAFPKIVDVYYSSLLAHARRRVFDTQAAEDIVQEALLRAYRALPRFEGEYRLNAWLHRIVDNLCTDHLINRKRNDELLTRLQVNERDVDDAIELDRVAEQQVVSQALGQLSEDHREALVLRFVEDQSYEEMALAVGVSEDTARARVSRARRAFRRVVNLPLSVGIAVAGVGRRFGGRTATPDGARGISPATVAAQLSPSSGGVTQTGVSMVTKVAVVVSVAVTASLSGSHDASTAPPPRQPVVAPVAETSRAPQTDAVLPSTMVATELAASDPSTSAPAIPADQSSTSSSSAEPTPSTKPALITVPAVSSNDSASSSSGGTPAAKPAEGTFEAADLQVTPAGPRYVVRGTASIVGADGSTTDVTVDGKILVDASDPSSPATVDGTLSLTTNDGRTLTLRIAGSAARRDTTDASASVTTYDLDARYTLDGADAVDLPRDGAIGGALTDRGDGTGSLQLSLRAYN